MTQHALKSKTFQPPPSARSMQRHSQPPRQTHGATSSQTSGAARANHRRLAPHIDATVSYPTVPEPILPYPTVPEPSLPSTQPQPEAH